MTENTKIEELLNSFVDGELTVRQRTEVKRMAANDLNIAKRLQKLQKCKMLVNAIPAAQAPAKILDNVKASIEAKAYMNEEKPLYHQPANTRFVLLRRVMAAAAMISIAAVLVVMTNMFLPGNTGGGRTDSIAEMKFSGKLELKTSEFAAVNSVINRAIDENGISGSVTSIKESNRRVYVINCSRAGFNGLLADLESGWNELDASKLSIDTDVFGRQVEIDNVTPMQIAEIVNQTDSQKSIQIARDFSVINNINALLPEGKIYLPGHDTHSDLITIPRPVMVKYYEPKFQDNGKKTVEIRIIVSR